MAAALFPSAEPGSAATGRARRLLHLLGLGALVALLLSLELPLCPLAGVFGVPCPGCGLTRAALALLHGNLRGAVGLHPLAPLVVPLLGLVVLKTAFDYVRGHDSRTLSHATPSGPSRRARRQLTTALAWCVLALVLGVWLARFAGAFGGPVPVQRLF